MKKFKKSYVIMALASSVLLLSACNSNQNEESTKVLNLEESAYTSYENQLKDNKEVKKEDNNNIMGVTFKDYDSIIKMMNENSHLKGDNLIDKFLKTSIFSSNQFTINKNDLNNTLLVTKNNLERMNKKYTREIKDEVTFNYILKKGQLELLNTFLKPTTEEIGKFKTSNEGVQFISYELDKKELENKSKEDILKDFKKGTSKINNLDDVQNNSLNQDYSVFNYTKANPLVNQKEYEFIMKNKKESYMILEKDNGITQFIKVIDNKPLSLNEKSAIITMLKFEQLAKKENPEYLAVNLLKTIDNNSDDVYLKPDVYKKLTGEIRKMSDEDKENFLDIFRKIYVDNYVTLL